MDKKSKTKRPFLKLIRVHIKPILKNKMEMAISRHVGLFHGFDPKIITFMALEHVQFHPRGGSVDKTLLQLEARWIYNLKVTVFSGFNKLLA